MLKGELPNYTKKIWIDEGNKGQDVVFALQFYLNFGTS